MSNVLLRGGTVIDGTGAPEMRADVAVDGDEIVAIGDLGAMEAGTVIDCTGRLILPGFVDTHSHADARIFDEDVQLALLRQGVTTVVVGQDGVSFAPGSGTYAGEYFAALNGTHPYFSGGTVAELLDSYGHGRTAVNVAYLVPQGTIRAEVMGFAARVPSRDELKSMRSMVERALEDGAVGMSSGMDYFPGAYGLAEEVAALCAPISAAAALYVTHLRGGYEHNAHVGVAELEDVARISGARAHISHYHGPGELLIKLVDDACERGIDLTFDSYPYRRGFTLLSTVLMPPTIQQLGSAASLAALDDPATVREMRHEFGGDPEWSDRVTIAHVADPEFSWAEGLTMTQIADSLDRSPFDAAIDILRKSGLAVSAVFEVGRSSNGEDVAALARHHRHMSGSDGIYVGSHPHPRGWGTFARMLARHTRDRRDWTWPDAVQHLSSRPAERFGLPRRGRLERGAIADIVVVDPLRVEDLATYNKPRTLAVGIDDVIVGGEIVIGSGTLTGVRSGVGIRRR